MAAAIRKMRAGRHAFDRVRQTRAKSAACRNREAPKALPRDPMDAVVEPMNVDDSPAIGTAPFSNTVASPAMTSMFGATGRRSSPHRT